MIFSKLITSYDNFTYIQSFCISGKNKMQHLSKQVTKKRSKCSHEFIDTDHINISKLLQCLSTSKNMTANLNFATAK